MVSSGQAEPGMVLEIVISGRSRHSTSQAEHAVHCIPLLTGRVTPLNSSSCCHAAGRGSKTWCRSGKQGGEWLRIWEMQTEGLEFLGGLRKHIQIGQGAAGCLLVVSSCDGKQDLWRDLKGLVLVHLGLWTLNATGKTRSIQENEAWDRSSDSPAMGNGVPLLPELLCHLSGARQRGEEQPSWSTWPSPPFSSWVSSQAVELPKARACPELNRLWRAAPASHIPIPAWLLGMLLLVPNSGFTFVHASYPLRTQICRANLCS